MSKKIENIGENNIVKILKGSGIAVIISIVLLIGVALLLAYTSIPESIISYAIIIICIISILVGSMLSSIKIKKQGIINGGAVGIIYIEVLYLLSSLIEKDFGLNGYSLAMIAAACLAGCIGGIIGVNLKK